VPLFPLALRDAVVQWIADAIVAPEHLHRVPGAGEPCAAETASSRSASARARDARAPCRRPSSMQDATLASMKSEVVDVRRIQNRE
jgi:hypothetical protein